MLHNYHCRISWSTHSDRFWFGWSVSVVIYWMFFPLIAIMFQVCCVTWNCQWWAVQIVQSMWWILSMQSHLPLPHTYDISHQRRSHWWRLINICFCIWKFLAIHCVRFPNTVQPLFLEHPIWSVSAWNGITYEHISIFFILLSVSYYCSIPIGHHPLRSSANTYEWYPLY